MSSKDLKVGLVVMKKFNFPQGSLKNAAHQVLELLKDILANLAWIEMAGLTQIYDKIHIDI